MFAERLWPHHPSSRQRMAVEDSQDATGPSYELSPVISSTDVAAGTNILVRGPAKTGKRKLGLRLLEKGSTNGQGAIIITANADADRIIEEYVQFDGATAETGLRVVDCSGHDRNGTSRLENDRVKYARSPKDVAGIGTSFSEFLDDCRNECGIQHNRVLLDSVSTLLMYLDLQTVFRFLEMFTRRIDRANAIGVFLINSAAHDTKTLNTVVRLFDATLRVADSTTSDEQTVQFESV